MTTRRGNPSVVGVWVVGPRHIFVKGWGACVPCGGGGVGRGRWVGCGPLLGGRWGLWERAWGQRGRDAGLGKQGFAPGSTATDAVLAKPESKKNDEDGGRQCIHSFIHGTCDHHSDHHVLEDKGETNTQIVPAFPPSPSPHPPKPQAPAPSPSPPNQLNSSIPHQHTRHKAPAQDTHVWILLLVVAAGRGHGPVRRGPGRDVRGRRYVFLPFPNPPSFLPPTTNKPNTTGKVGGKRTLVLLDSFEIKETHSQFFGGLAARGHVLTYLLANSPDVVLYKYGQPSYDNLLLFAPSTVEFAALDAASIASFMAQGGNLMLAADKDMSELTREIAAEYVPYPSLFSFSPSFPSTHPPTHPPTSPHKQTGRGLRQETDCGD